MSKQENMTVTSPEASETAADYFAKRQLKKGAVGWLLLIGLGVAKVPTRKIT